MQLEIRNLMSHKTMHVLQTLLKTTLDEDNMAIPRSTNIITTEVCKLWVKHQFLWAIKASLFCGVFFVYSCS